jgi:DNA-binding beta-propeller fold protein YncE
MRYARCFLATVLAFGGCSREAAIAPAAQSSVASKGGGFEVWLVDQSNSNGLAYGGTIHIYPHQELRRGGNHVAQGASIDLAGATSALCMTATGANPVRPHMLLFNASHTHAVLSFVASGHVVIFDAAARTPVSCIRTSAGAGGARQAHAAFPSPDGSYILVANQNGKLLERIDANFGANAFTLNPAATIDLANCTTPNSVPCQSPTLRPDNAPICPIVDDAGRLGFITLRGGGMFVVNPRVTPMQIIAEYDQATVHGNGCGGLQVDGNMFMDSGGGTASNMAEFDLYSFKLRAFSITNLPNMPSPELIYTDDTAPQRDAHGMAVTHKGRYLWVADRATNVAEVFDTRTNERVGAVNMVGAESDDPTPDLADTSPSGDLLFFSLRGPNPLSGDPHVSTGSTPGLAVVHVRGGGSRGRIGQVVRISNVDAAGVERADAHGLRVRRVP